MNYRHAFHAGNFADVLKHAILALCVRHLTLKEKPFRYIDTHAGIGLYDLSGDEATRTGESDGGIRRLLLTLQEADADERACLAPYLEVVRAVNPAGLTPATMLTTYPGSSMIAARLSRASDRLSLCELHSEDADRLAATFAGDRRIKVEQRDGFGAIRAYLPPKERRGLVLIDPPFEQAGEFDRMVKALEDGIARWATGTFLLWYPVKDPGAADAFLARLETSGIPRILVAELVVAPPGSAPGLSATGLAMVNPPWTIASDLAVLLPFLTRSLIQTPARGTGARGLTVESRHFWLTPE